MDGIKWVRINTGVSVDVLRGMISRIPCADERLTLDRCSVAERWIRANEVISDAEYDELISAVESIEKPIWDAKKEKAAAAFAAFIPVGDKKNPLPIRQYYEQANKAGCSFYSGGLELVSFEQVQFYDVTILRDKCGNLWESLYPVGD